MDDAFREAQDQAEGQEPAAPHRHRLHPARFLQALRHPKPGCRGQEHDTKQGQREVPVKLGPHHRCNKAGNPGFAPEHTAPKTAATRLTTTKAALVLGRLELTARLAARLAAGETTLVSRAGIDGAGTIGSAAPPVKIAGGTCTGATVGRAGATLAGKTILAGAVTRQGLLIAAGVTAKNVAQVKPRLGAALVAVHPAQAVIAENQVHYGVIGAAVDVGPLVGRG